jgi:hypothetical protein
MKKKGIAIIILLLSSSLFFAQQSLNNLDNWAAQQTEDLDADKVVNFLNRSASSNVAFGSAHVFTTTGSWPDYINGIALDESTFVVVYVDKDDQYGKAVAGTIAGNQISYGSIVTFNPEITTHCCTAELTSTKFVVAFYDFNGGTSRGNALVGTVSGNALTFGSDNIIESGGSSAYFSAAGLDDDDFVLTYQYANEGNAKIGRVSGTTISFGNPSIFNGGDNITYSKVTALDGSEFAVIYNDDSNSDYGTAQVGTRSGTTISSWGSEAVFISASMSWGPFCITGLESNRFVIGYTDPDNDDYGKVIVGEAGSGNSITFGAETTFNQGKTQEPNISALDQAHVVITYRDRGHYFYGTATIGTIAGNTITTGLEYVYNNYSSGENNPIVMNAGKFVVSFSNYNGTNYSSSAIVGDITYDLTQDIFTDQILCSDNVMEHTANSNYVHYASFNKEDDDWVNCNNVAPEIAGTNRSIFMWMNKDTQVPSGDAQMLLGLNTASGGAISNFYIGSNEKLAIHDGNNVRATSKVVTDGLWHFVGYTYDEATNETKIYADGVLLTTFTNGQSIASDGQVSLGQEFDNAALSNLYDGKITEVSFWNEVLDETDISIAMDTAISSSHPKYANLKAYYPMIANSTDGFSVADDFSGNNNNGNCSHNDIQSIDLVEISGYNSALNYTKNWIANGSSVGTGNSLSLGTPAEGNYSLVLSTEYVEITDDWTLSIVDLPVISFQPVDTLSAVDESAFFETAGAGGDTYTYQWGEVINNYANRTTLHGLGNNYSTGVFESGGTIYVATIGGLSISTDGGISFINKTTTNGLGSNNCKDVIESGETIYAATGGGLSISTDDGTSFINRTTADGLGNIFCLEVYESGGTIYVSTYGGLSISTDGGTSFVNKTTTDGLGSNSISGAYESSGTIYVATSGGLSISTDGGTSFINKTTTDGLGNNSCSGVYESNGTIYAATIGGISISTDGGTSFMNKTTADGLGHDYCSGVYESNGTIYTATRGGISMSTDGGTSFTNKTIADGLGDNDCRAVFESNGIIFVATKGGLSISPLWDEISGETAASMNLTATSEMDNAYYSAQITSTSTGCINYSDTVQLFVVNSWDGSTDSDWNTTANWADDALPTLTDTIIIRDVTNKPIIGATGTASCNKLILNTGTTLTIESTASGTGSLIVNGPVTNNGTITAQRFVTAGAWHGITSPLTGNTANSYYLNANPDVWLKEHNEATNTYTYLTSLTTPLTDMKGFFMWVDETTAQTFEYQGGLLIDEVGSNNNMIRSASGAENGWNFIGNPFTSAIDWNAASGWTKTNIDNTIYVYNSPNWSTWNGSTGTNGGTQYVASGQGFFVNVTEGNSEGTLKMDDGVKVHNSVSFLKQGARNLENLIRIELTDNEYTDETVIHLSETATEDFDPDFDAHKLTSFIADAPQIFSTLPVKMAINSLPVSTSEVDIDVTGADDTNMTISLTENNGFSNIYLSDNHTGMQINLIYESYNFHYDSDITNRFTIYFTMVGVEDEINVETARVYSYGNEISAIIPEGQNNEIIVYNLIGQTIFETRGVPGINMITIDKTGYYIVKLIGKNSILSKKVFIKN